MHVLVTGTAGFIGSHVALKLLERGHEVIGFDNLNDYYDVELKRAPGPFQWTRRLYPCLRRPRRP